VHKKKAVVRKRKHVRPQTHVVTTPEPAAAVAPAPLPHLQIGAKTAAVTSSGSPIRRVLVIIGLAITAFFFALVAAVPATEARFTVAGRVVMNHQTDLVLAGVATLLLTAMLFLVTGRG